jgi:hypothetical protein
MKITVDPSSEILVPDASMPSSLSSWSAGPA